MDREEKISKLIKKLQLQLQEKNWWETDIEPEKLTSTVAFSADKLSFTQWLQWIFIPKTQLFIDNNVSLPRSCNMLPIAEEAWKNCENIADLLTTITELDQAFNS